MNNLDLVEKIIEARLSIIRARKAMNELYDTTQSVLVNLERGIPVRKVVKKKVTKKKVTKKKVKIR